MTSFAKNYYFSYDSSSRLTSLTRGSVTTDFTYQDQNLKLIKHSANGNSISENEYSYNLRNYPTQKRTLASISSYNYDSNGQLTQNSNSEASLSETFTYDSLGNRLIDNNRTYDYDQTGQRLTQDTFYTYQYDNNGNLINKISRDGLKDSFHFDYSSLNHLIKLQRMTGTLGSLAIKKEVVYSYDALGRRIQKEVKDLINNVTNIRKYTYNGSNIIAEYDGNNALLAKYTHSPLSADDILAAEFTTQGKNSGLTSQTGVVYYLKDHLNSITDITDESGNIIQKYEYSSFGEIKKIKDSSNNIVSFNSAPIKTSFTYTGREFDSESDLFYYRARYYDASIGRFLQQDPHPGRVNIPTSISNKYSYTLNTPTLFRDPSGRDIWDSLGKAVAIIAGVALAAYGGAAIVAYLGLTGFSGVLVGALVGSVIGGTVTAIGFSLSHSDPNEGFRVGAAFGLAAGGIGGFSPSTFTSIKEITDIELARKFASLFGSGSNVDEAAMFLAKDQVAMTGLHYAAEVGTAAYAIDLNKRIDKCTTQRDCSNEIPTISIPIFAVSIPF